MCPRAISACAREIGYLFGYYKKLKNQHNAVITGRGLSYGGSLGRKEATGYGLIYLVKEMMRKNDLELSGKTIIISGSGNVAIYACQKAQQLGAKVVAMSDSDGYIYDKKGIDLEAVKQIKEADRKRIYEYLNYHPDAVYTQGCKKIWETPCDIALPCATQNELDYDDAVILLENGCKVVGEGANMPCTNEAQQFFIDKKIYYAPGKAANAGGVATSALEMAQSSQRMFWSFEEVDSRLENIMRNIFNNIDKAAEEYGYKGNYIVGSNIAGFFESGECHAVPRSCVITLSYRISENILAVTRRFSIIAPQSGSQQYYYKEALSGALSDKDALRAVTTSPFGQERRNDYLLRFSKRQLSIISAKQQNRAGSVIVVKRITRMNRRERCISF